MLEISGITRSMARVRLLAIVCPAHIQKDVSFWPRQCDTYRCERLNLCTNLLPSANQICREVTGRAWSSVTMGIGGDSPSSCTDGDLATTLGATLGVNRNEEKKKKSDLQPVKSTYSLIQCVFSHIILQGVGRHNLTQSMFWTF